MADDKPAGFVALKSLRKAPADPANAIAEIRKIYFRTTKKTIEHDLMHAIELLKSLPDDETRDRAGVYMEGLQQMKAEWYRSQGKAGPPKRGRGPRRT